MSPRATGDLFERLVCDHHAAVYRAAYHVLGNADDAMDAAQQVFLKVLERRGRLVRSQDPGRVLRWLAVRTAYMHLRSASARRERERSQAMRNPESSSRGGLEHDEERGALRRLLAVLPDELRLALNLRFQEGLTYADIASVTECSEPTAHDRVRRGLERLRVRLRDAGFGAVALRVEDGLAAAGPVEVPAMLKGKLLSLASAKAMALPAAGSVLVLGFVLAGVLGLGWYLGFGRPAGEPPRGAVPGLVAGAGGEEAAVAAEDSPAREEAVAAGTVERAGGTLGAEESAAAPAVVRGTVVDAFGQPRAGLEVTARSVERDGKFPAIARSTVSDATGAFVLEVPVAVAGFQEFSLGVEYDDATVLVQDGLRLVAGQVYGEQLLLEAPIDERDGEYVLDVSVRDPSGAPVSGAWVAVDRAMRTRGDHRWHRREVEGRTDAQGAVRLVGEKTGKKRLGIATLRRGWVVKTVDFEVGEPGLSERTVEVNYPDSIAGSVVDTAGQAIEQAAVVAWSEGDRSNRYSSITAADGGFSFRGVLPGSYGLQATAPGFGSAVVADVDCGRGDARLVLRRAGETASSDFRDGSIRGRMLDALTGEPLAQVFPDVDLLRVPDVSAEEIARDFLPNHVFEFPAQVVYPEVMPPPTDRFHIDELPRRCYMVRGYFDGRAPCFLGPLDLRETREIRDVVLRFRPGAQIAGQVLDAAGRPLANAFVFLTGSGSISDREVADRDELVRRSAGRGTFHFTYWKTDDQGRFESDGMPFPTDIPLCLAAVHPDHVPLRTGVIPLIENQTTSGLTLRFTTPRQR